MNTKYSPSRQKKFNLCKRWYYLNYIERWEETTKAPWLEYGTKIDKLLGIYDTKGLKGCLAAIKEHFSNLYDRIDTKYLLTYYDKKSKKIDLPSKSFMGQPGNQFKFDISIQPSCLNYSLQILGYIDKVTEYDGFLAFVERKTTSQSITQSPFSEYWKGIAIDKQIVCYSYALSESIQGQVNRCFYEVFRKPTPTVNKCFDKKGKPPLKDYEVGVAEYFEKPKKDMFLRRKFWITQDARDEWLMDLIADDKANSLMQLEQKELEGKKLNGQYAWPRNQHSCGAFGGCPFFDYCEGKSELKQMQNIYQKRRF